MRTSAHIFPRYLAWLVHIAIYWVNTPCSLCGWYQEFVGKLSPDLPWVQGSKAGPSSRAVCGRSPAAIVGSNPARGMDVVECCESLRLADYSPRGVLLTVVRRWVWSRNLKNEEAIPRVGPQRHKKKKWKSTFLRQFQCRNFYKDKVKIG